MSKENPLGMRAIEPGGPFVLSPVLCSGRRKQYFERGNRILSMYGSLTAYASFGKKAIDQSSKDHSIDNKTPMRIRVAGHVMQTSFQQLKRSFARSGAQLTNQVFLMIYGNFEAFLFDIVHDALLELGIGDAIQDSISLLAGKKWRGKLDRVAQEFSVPVKRRELGQEYKSIEMRFLGKPYDDPVDFLQSMADLRHRLIHGGARADEHLVDGYPDAGIEVGQYIELPFGLPFSVFYFYVPITDYLDRLFCQKFSWERELVAPEHLVE